MDKEDLLRVLGWGRYLQSSIIESREVNVRC